MRHVVILPRSYQERGPGGEVVARGGRRPKAGVPRGHPVRCQLGQSDPPLGQSARPSARATAPWSSRLDPPMRDKMCSPVVTPPGRSVLPLSYQERGPGGEVVARGGGRSKAGVPRGHPVRCQLGQSDRPLQQPFGPPMSDKSLPLSYQERGPGGEVAAPAAVS
jgi:hypothetical protein